MKPIEITIGICRNNDECDCYLYNDDPCPLPDCPGPGTYVLVPRQEWENATSSFGYMQKKIAALQERIRVLSGGEPQPDTGGGDA